jgi:predicted dinucleotide-binding enzyme
MDIGIIGAGHVAQAFARHALHVGHTIKISNSRGPSTLRDTVHTLGAGVTAVTTAEAAASELVVLAVPWDDVVGVLTHLPPWQQRIVDQRAHSNRNLRFHPPEKSWLLQEPDFDFLDEFFSRFSARNGL